MTTIDLMEGFFGKALVASGTRIAPKAKKSKIRLNRNEAALDIDEDIKRTISNEVANIEWKNYPPPYYSQIEDLIGLYSGVRGEQVVPAAGSASLITTLLNYSAINSRQIVIARPSFSLYEYHCNSYGIPFETWWLNKDLEYEIQNIPELKPYSIVMFASPNNPVGNLIKKDEIKFLLNNYPQTFFIVDEVYHEFSGYNLTPLIQEFPNLILLRSFSKSFSAAGLRVGYLIAQENIAEQIRKLILPFSLNYLSMVFVNKVLTDKNVIRNNRKNIEFVISEKERIESELVKMDKYSDRYFIKKTYGNFILLIFNSKVFFSKTIELLDSAGIEILDLSKVPLLNYALRMTIGKTEENNKVLDVFKMLSLK